MMGRGSREVGRLPIGSDDRPVPSERVVFGALPYQPVAGLGCMDWGTCTAARRHSLLAASFLVLGWFVVVSQILGGAMSCCIMTMRRCLLCSVPVITPFPTPPSPGQSAHQSAAIPLPDPHAQLIALNAFTSLAHSYNPSPSLHRRWSIRRSRQMAPHLCVRAQMVDQQLPQDLH